MSTSRWFIALVFASMAVLSAQAEGYCPGNAASLRFPVSSRFQIVVPVTIDHAASYEFLGDTGTQFTQVDPSLVGKS